MTVEAVPYGAQATAGPFARLLAKDSVCRIEEVYRPSGYGTLTGAGPPPENRAHAQYSAVVAAYHQRLALDRPLMLSWARRETGGPVTVACTTTAAGGQYPAALVFPPGTRGRPAAPESVYREFEALTWWVPIAGTVDALVSALDPQPGWPGGSAGLEQELLAGWHGPFAWVLLAHPVPWSTLEREAEKLALAERDARSRAASPQNAVQAERLARRHREARAGRSTGMWRVHLLAGGVDEPSAAAVAGLLAAGQDLRATPYVLAPLAPVRGIERAYAAVAGDPGEAGVPFLAGPSLVAALAQVPLSEVPGLRLAERSTFDVTPEIVMGAESVSLAEVLDHNELPAGPLHIGYGTLNRHTFVCGATGAGKSQTVRTLLERLATAPRPVPWLVIEPAKAEYARMAGRLRGHGKVLVIRPGDPDTVPGCLNPLEPEPGFPLQTHIDLVRALFQAAFEATDPLPQVLAQALTHCYEQFGWQIAISEPASPWLRQYPALSDLRSSALTVVQDIGYGREVTDNVRGFVDVRLGSLTLGTTGRFFEGGHPLDLPAMLGRNTVLELQDIGNDQDKAFLIGAILIRITEFLRQRHRDGTRVPLRHVTVIEEAHRLLKRVLPGSPAAHAVELFASLLAEVRAYGEGIIVAEQIPAKIIPDVVKNSALKIVHRLPARDDRDSVGATMNLTEQQSRWVVTLPPGRAAVFADGMDQPVLAALPLGEDRESAAGADRDPGILRTRAASCGPACRERACTLREMADGARLGSDPKLILWIELLTVAHIVGEPAPVPAEAWCAGLSARAGPRMLQCAVGYCVQASVAVRFPGLARCYDPLEFSMHLAAQAAALLGGEPATCDGTEYRWQAAHFRWIDVRRALQNSPETAGQHPDTGQWRARGLDLPGRTIAEQRAQYQRHPDVRRRDDTTLRGTSKPPLYESAASALADHRDPLERLITAKRYLNTGTTWPQVRLYPKAWQQRRGAP